MPSSLKQKNGSKRHIFHMDMAEIWIEMKRNNRRMHILLPKVRIIPFRITALYKKCPKKDFINEYSENAANIISLIENASYDFSNNEIVDIISSDGVLFEKICESNLSYDNETLYAAVTNEISDNIKEDLKEKILQSTDILQTVVNISDSITKNEGYLSDFTYAFDAEQVFASGYYAFDYTILDEHVLQKITEAVHDSPDVDTVTKLFVQAIPPLLEENTYDADLLNDQMFNSDRDDINLENIPYQVANGTLQLFPVDYDNEHDIRIVQGCRTILCKYDENYDDILSIGNLCLFNFTAGECLNEMVEHMDEIPLAQWAAPNKMTSFYEDKIVSALSDLHSKENYAAELFESADLADDVREDITEILQDAFSFRTEKTIDQYRFYAENAHLFTGNEHINLQDRCDKFYSMALDDLASMEERISGILEGTIDRAEESETILENRLTDEEKPKYFINFTNHKINDPNPKLAWTSRQIAACEEHGMLADYPFPNVDPHSTTEQIQQMAHEIVNDMVQEYGNNIEILNQGQNALVIAVNKAAAERGIQTYVATTEKNKDSTIPQPFKFIGLREMNTPGREYHTFEPDLGGPVINYAGRSANTWSQEQLNGTLEQFHADTVIDFKPLGTGIVPSDATKEDLQEGIKADLLAIKEEYHPSCIVLGTEMSANQYAAEYAEQLQIPAVVGMSARNVVITENENGEPVKNVQWEFCGNCNVNNIDDTERDRDVQNRDTQSHDD